MATAPLPDPARVRWVFAYVDLLYELYGPDRGTWPPSDEWPVPLWPVPVGASRECSVCGGRDGNHFPWCGHARHLPAAGAS